MKNGVAVNVDGRSTQQTYGLIKEQEKFLLKLDKQNVAKGLSVTERQAASNQAIKDLQQLNTNAQTYGKLPTQFKDTVGDLADLNNNGIPDAQEGFWLGAKSLASTIIGLVTGKTYNIPTNFNQLESTVAEVATEFANKTIDLKKKLAAADIEVKNANAKRVIDTNNAMIGNIQTMLGERVEQNKQQYVDAVSGVYRQLGGQVKQFQRIIGADGVAIDDATMLSLMGWVGVDSMAKIVDLKNVLVNDYLKQKEWAIKDIYALEKNNDLTANEAATAVAAITAQAEVDVLDLTKTFYQEMFGMAKSDFERTQTTTANTRNAVDSYLANIGITPLQRNQIINNYVKAGYTTEEAITKLSQDIRDGTNPVINDVTKNNADAAASANAKFTQEMALKITPIVTEGKIKLELQDDKQEFDAAQNALDRSRRASEAKSKTKAPKTLSEWAMINANKQVTARWWAPFTGNETVVDVLNIGYASQVLARPDEHTVEDVQDATTYMKWKWFQESDLIGTEWKQKMSSLTTGISKVIVVPNVEVTPIEVQ